MNTKHLLTFAGFFVSLFCMNEANAQDKRLEITGMPFDSLVISNLKATGLKKTGEVTIALEFQNKYVKLQTSTSR